MYGFVNGYVIEEGVGAQKITLVGCNLEGSHRPPHVTVRNQCSSQAGASGVASGGFETPTTDASNSAKSNHTPSSSRFGFGLNQRSKLPSWKTFCKSKGIKIKTP